MDFRSADYNALLEWVLPIVPELGIAMQKSGKRCPPDCEQEFGGSMFYFFPREDKHVRWQVKEEIIPKFIEWFDDARLDFPDATTEPEYWQEVTLSEKKWNSVTLMFASTYCTAILGQMIPYARMTLRELLQPSWGEILNTAATLGLLYLGETDVDHTLFHKLFPVVEAPLEHLYHSLHYRDYKRLRIFEPRELPAFYWRAVFRTLSHIRGQDHALVQSLLVYSLGELGARDLEREIYGFALSQGVYCPLTISGTLAINSYSSEERRQLYQCALSDALFCDRYPDYAETLKQSL